MKRWRTPTAKPGELKAAYGRSEYDTSLDLQYAWGADGAGKADARVLMSALEDADVFDGKNLRQVLTDRGYDITTLRFSI